MLPKYKAYFSKLQIRLYLNKLYVVRYLKTMAQRNIENLI